MNYAPVVVFCYNRPDHIKKTLAALSDNLYAQYTDVFIFVDGIRNPEDSHEKSLHDAVLDVVANANGYKTKIVEVANRNQGLAKSIINGVSKVIEKYGRVIVLEDDIVTGKFFLEYMNNALERYELNKNVWHITGWHNPTLKENSTDSFFYPLMDCWSWATWADRWKHFEKNPQKLINTMSKKEIKKINVDGLVPNKWAQVIGNYKGVNNTWAIFWYATIMNHNGLCLAPANSLVKNVGFDNTGVHSTSKEKYEIPTDINHKIEIFPEKAEIDSYQYEIIKNDYRRRFRKERIKNSIGKFLPESLKRFLRTIKG